jgi:hypothetical protein
MKHKQFFRSMLAFVLAIGLLAGLYVFVAHARAGQAAPAEYTPHVEVVAPAAGDLITRTPQVVTMTYDCRGSLCLGTLRVEVVSVTVDGGQTYTEASLHMTDTLEEDGVYTYEWHLPSEDYVSHTIISRARDAYTRTGVSSPVTVHVDTVAPTVWLTLPTYTKNVTFPVAWRVEDGSGEVSYTLAYQRDDDLTQWTAWPSGTSYLTQTGEMSDTFTVTPQTIDEGHTYHFRLRAYDKGHNTSAVTESIRVGKWRLYLPLVLRNYPPRFDYVNLSIDESHTYDADITVNFSASVIGDRIQRVGLRNHGETDWTIRSVISDTNIHQPFDWALPVATQLHTVEAIAFGETITSAIASASVYYVPNGGFEQAGLANWTITTDKLPASRVNETVGHPGSTGAAEGSFMLLLGNPSYTGIEDVPLGYASAARTFDVPDEGAPTLDFKYIIWSQDQSTNENYDRFEVYVNDVLVVADGNQNAGLAPDKWWRVPSPENPRGDEGEITSGWATKRINLSGYAGQEITVSFQNHSRYDNVYNTYTYVDDVHITGGW